MQAILKDEFGMDPKHYFWHGCVTKYLLFLQGQSIV